MDVNFNENYFVVQAHNTNDSTGTYCPRVEVRNVETGELVGAPLLGVDALRALRSVLEEAESLEERETL